MKRFCIALLALCLLCITTESLLSQDRTSSSDTTWIYDFQSETDSTFQLKELYGVFDSADINEVILMNTDQLNGDWQLGTKFWSRLNQEGQDIMKIRYSWDMDLEQWVESHLYQYFYDQWGNDTLSLSSYKYGTDEWTSAQGNRYVNSYNDKDQLIQVEVHKGYPGQESEYEKYEYTYDESGNRILTIRYNFGMDWALNARYETGFDAEGRRVEEITYYRMGTEWVKSVRTVWEYDASGNNTVLEASVWDEDPGQWRMYHRDDITYDQLGKKLLLINQNSAAYGEPIITTQSEYFYNLSGKLAITVISLLDEDSGAYVLTQKKFTRHGGEYEITCDSICTGEIYSWEGESIETGGTYHKEFVSAMGLDSIKTLYLKENSNPVSFTFTGASETVKDGEELYVAPNDPELEYRWTVENGTVLPGTWNDTLGVRWDAEGTGKVTAWALNIHGCSSDSSSVNVLIGPNGVDDLSAAGVVLYPVPVKDVLLVQCDLEFVQIGVVDLSGRKVAATHGTSIDLLNLPAGTYVVQLKNRDGTLIGTQKIVKE